MEKLNVLYLTDNNYAAFAGVSITSMFENNKHINEITVYLIDDHMMKPIKKNLAYLPKNITGKLSF